MSEKLQLHDVLNIFVFGAVIIAIFASIVGGPVETYSVICYTDADMAHALVNPTNHHVTNTIVYRIHGRWKDGYMNDYMAESEYCVWTYLWGPK